MKYTSKEFSNIHHVFQPIYHLKNNEIYGYELLLRSASHPNPEKFFSLAKKNNQLYEVDMISIEEAFQTIEKHKQILEDKYLFINIFPSTLLHKDFLLKFGSLQAKNKIDANHIVFEVNEAEKAENLEDLNHILNELKSYGFQIALDDLGKGEFTFRSIVELEPTIAKIDRFFSQGLKESSKKQKLLKLLLEFFESDSRVILEGLEYEEDLESAKSLGITFGQGFLLGKPEPLL